MQRLQSLLGANAAATAGTPGGAALTLIEGALQEGRLADVLGIFEQWKTSMQLLNALVPLDRGERWQQAAAQRKSTFDSHKWKDAELEAIAAARQDKAVEALLMADRRLYLAGRRAFSTMCMKHLYGGASQQQ